MVRLGLALCVNEYSKAWNKLAVIEDMEPHVTPCILLPALDARH